MKNNKVWRSVYVAVLTAFTLTATVGTARAAKEDGCSGGGFSVFANIVGATIPASGLPASFTVQGKFIEFEVDSTTFGIRNYTLTGAPSPDRLTTIPIVVFASKIPDLRGLKLSSDISIQNAGGTLNLQRTGPGITMKLQALDCSTGGIFQMEVERGDGTATDFTHTLSASVFYFNNPNFGPPPPPLPLCPANGPFTPACTPIPITPRVNFASDLAAQLVGRDSPQDATKISQTGGTSVWRVVSGGRMGGVFGEDAVEVAPPAKACTSHCQGQDQVRGKFPVLGFPSPVPTSARITPR